MWSDILKALELLTKIISGDMSNKRVRRKIARRLIRIYLNVDRVVSRGRHILKALIAHNEYFSLPPALARRYSIPCKAVLPGDLVSDECRALQSLLDSLNEPEIRSLLKVQLPGFVAVDELVKGKWNKIRSGWVDSPTFELSRLTTGAQSSRGDNGIPPDMPSELQFAEALNVTVLFDAAVIEKEQRIIEAIAAEGERLRSFLVEHFQLEELLQPDSKD